MASTTTWTRRFVGTLILALALPMAACAPSASAAGALGPVGRVQIVGDSITHMVFSNYATDGLPSTWRTDAVSGRRVTALGQHMTGYSTDLYVRRHRYFNVAPRSVSTLVLALGSNAPDSDLTLAQTESLYLAAVEYLIHSNVWATSDHKIVMVTPFRDARYIAGGVNPQSGQPLEPFEFATNTTKDAAAIYWVAAHVPHNVCIMDWRLFAATHQSVLMDGVHPNALGRSYWVRMLGHSLRACS